MLLVMLGVSLRNASAAPIARGPGGPYPFPQAAFGTARVFIHIRNEPRVSYVVLRL
jgi:hypothetical protein